MRKAFAAVFVAYALTACGSPAATASPPAPLALERSSLIVETQSGAHRFAIEIADEEAEQERGLMYRTAMAADAGMLFVYPAERTITMWMENTVLPLDMVFIRADGRVAAIARDAVPYSRAIISSGGPALAVLEVNAGVTEAIGLKPGDRIRHGAFGTTP